jgi:hypothetical protein
MNAVSVQQDVKLFRKVLGTLNEAQRRWVVGREALRHGRGGELNVRANEGQLTDDEQG